MTINIEIKNHDRLKDFFNKVHGQMEDKTFSIIQQIPEKFIPHWLMNRLEKYLAKRISELQQESVKMTWRHMYLQNSLTEIHNRQQDAKEAPSDN